MKKSSILIFECTGGNADKFYTMIALDNGKFHANYGPNGHKEWVKTIERGMGVWQDTWDTRIAHDYTLISNEWIDADEYLSIKERLEKVQKEYPKGDLLKGTYKTLLKYGTLTADQKRYANTMYQETKKHYST